MAHTIHKYVVDARVCHVATYDGAQFLSVGSQHGHITVWAHVDTDRPLVVRELVIVATGSERLPDLDHADYVGTAQLQGGNLVFHVFLVEQGYELEAVA